ncbi:hypothetical protein L1987_43392 [Smallanthus sonchifolius]|uniref:Uncharacterized protein n=1 Tax=Smallanthus sonchifolius TaxID=185202 RepID=A0ACB9GMP4_9ASTR|nr:hypothetical protein L1987_43392 [Smallanthus sonchifolius]
MYCSRCNGLLLEGFVQVLMYGKSLQQDGLPGQGLTTTQIKTLTLLDCYLYSKHLKGLQNEFDSARAEDMDPGEHVLCILLDFLLTLCDIIHSIINMDAVVTTIKKSRSDKKLQLVFREGSKYGAGIGARVYNIHSPKPKAVCI